MGYKADIVDKHELATPHRKARLRAMDLLDDYALLQQIAQKDKTAFAELVKRLESKLFNIAYHITGNRDLAEEILQEALLKVWQTAGTFKPQATGSVQGWISRIVGHQSIAVLRHRRRGQEVERERSRGSGYGSDENLPNPESLEHRELQSALKQGLAGLSPLERQLVAFSYGAGLSHREIGEALSIPNRTVTLRIQEALENLRTKLNQAGFAASLPLLGTGVLEEALGAGLEAPAGISAKVLQLAETRVEQVANTVSNRVGAIAQPARTSMRWAGIGVLAACAVAIGLAWRQAKPEAQSTFTPKHDVPQIPPVAAKPILADREWIPVPTGPINASRYNTRTFRTESVEKGARRIFSHIPGDNSLWSAVASAQGTTLTFSGGQPSENYMVYLGEPVESPCEFTCRIEYLDQNPSGSICFFLASSDFKGVLFGEHAAIQGPSDARFLVWQMDADTRALSIRKVKGFDKVGVGLEKLRIPDGRFLLGFGSNVKVAFCGIRMKKLPKNWDPESDPVVSAVLNKRDALRNGSVKTNSISATLEGAEAKPEKDSGVSP